MWSGRVSSSLSDIQMLSRPASMFVWVVDTRFAPVLTTAVLTLKMLSRPASLFVWVVDTRFAPNNSRSDTQNVIQESFRQSFWHSNVILPCLSEWLTLDLHLTTAVLTLQMSSRRASYSLSDIQMLSRLTLASMFVWVADNNSVLSEIQISYTPHTLDEE